jgi:hypothetical protein
MWAWMGEEQTWAAFSMLSQHSRPRVFQGDGALVTRELDASGYRKTYGSGHQVTRIESGGLAERGGEGIEMFCAISQRRYQKSVPRACMH